MCWEVLQGVQNDVGCVMPPPKQECCHPTGCHRQPCAALSPRKSLEGVGGCTDPAWGVTLPRLQVSPKASMGCLVTFPQQLS